jgi:hypothetical protein
MPLSGFVFLQLSVVNFASFRNFEKIVRKNHENLFLTWFLVGFFFFFKTNTKSLPA